MLIQAVVSTLLWLASFDFEDASALASYLNWPVSASRAQSCDAAVLSQLTPPEPEESSENARLFCFTASEPDAQTLRAELEAFLARDEFAMQHAAGPAATYRNENKTIEIVQLPARLMENAATGQVFVIGVESKNRASAAKRGGRRGAR